MNCQTPIQLYVLALIAAIASPKVGFADEPFRVAVYGGSATAFLQEQAEGYTLEVLEVSDRDVLSGELDPNAYDLLLLLGGGGRSDGQLYNAAVKHLDMGPQPEAMAADPSGAEELSGPWSLGGRRGGAGGRSTITQEQAAAAEKVLRSAIAKGKSPSVVATKRVYEAILKRHADLAKEPRLVGDVNLDGYVGRGHTSRENLRRLLGYLSVTYAGREGEAEPPAPVSTSGFYHPEFGDFQPTVAGFHKWAADQGVDTKSAPRILVLANYTHFVSRNQQGIDAMIRALTERDALAAGVIVEDPTNLLAMLEYEPDVTIDAFHRGDDVEFRKQLDVPHLQALWLSGRQTVEEWQLGVTHTGSMLGLESGEASGSIEPHIVAGRKEHGAAYEPIPDRVQRIVDRALAWAKLRRKSNREKRLVMLTSVGPSGDLDSLNSLHKLLVRLEEAGYQVGDLPRNATELHALIEDHGEQINPPEAQRLDELARSGKAALIPLSDYLRWLSERVPEAQRREMIDRWGEPPGDVMTWVNDAGERFLIVPQVELGNVTLVPKPQPWSADRLKKFDQHKRERGSAPSHNILATYFWLEEAYNADACVVWGSLGFDLLSRGKAVGVRASDWPDILMGDMPNIRPYSLGAITFALPAKRRAKAVLVDYLPAPRLSVGLDDGLFELQSELVKWNRLREGPLKQRFRESITNHVKRLNLDGDLGRTGHTETLSDEQLAELSLLLAEYESERVAPVKHVLGEPPRQDAEIPYLVRCLGARFLDELDAALPQSFAQDALPGQRRIQVRSIAEQAVASIVRNGLSPGEAAESIGLPAETQSEELLEGLSLAERLHDAIQKCPDEIEHIVAALDGRFVPPGPSAPPERNPASVPTGRNMYIMNPEEIPTRQSWLVAVGLVDDLLANSLRESGDYPERIAYTIRTRATMSDFGVSEAQVLYTLGVRPVWSSSGRVTDIEMIPREELARPRIDVLVEPKHHYAEYLDSRMRLIDRAVRLVAELDEPDNYVLRHSLEIAKDLVRRGETKERAHLLSVARMFGVAPERFGSGLHDRLFGATGVWNNEDQLVDVYAHQHAFAYTEGLWGEESFEGFRRQLAGTDVVVRSMNRGSALSGRAAYSGGMLALAAERLSGRAPEYYLTDLRDPGAERLYTAQQAVRRALRTELLNSKWIENKMAQPRGGAMAMSAQISRVLDWNITTAGVVEDATWKEIAEVYLADKKSLGVVQWLAQDHPKEYRGVLESMLEAVRKGYWRADADTVSELARRHAELAEEPGEVNEALISFVSSVLPLPNDSSQTRAAISQDTNAKPAPTADVAPEVTEAVTDAAASSTVTSKSQQTVQGRRLAPMESNGSPAVTSQQHSYWLAAAAAALMLLGAWLQIGAPRS